MILLTGKNDGFTLVELMLGVVILSFGLVAVIGAYLTANRALNSAWNRLGAIEFLKEKYFSLKEEAIENNGLKELNLEEEVALNNHSAFYLLQFSPVFSSEKVDLKKELSLVELSLSWKEGAVDKGVAVFTYFEKRQ